MEGYLTLIVFVILAVLFQFFISNSKWQTSTKILSSIGLFLFMLLIHATILALDFFLSYNSTAQESKPAYGFAFVFLSMWVVGVSIIAGIAQSITAVVIWLIRRNRKKRNDDIDTIV